MFKSSNENIIKIPKDAIRIRIIANSNTLEDQQIKLKIVSRIEKKFKNLINNNTSYEEARKIVEENIPAMENIIENITNSKDYKISYGNNYFPQKVFKSVLYEEGYYESLVITLGKGAGGNWWCVLFPPLCLIDIDENVSHIEYRFLIKSRPSGGNSRRKLAGTVIYNILR